MRPLKILWISNAPYISSGYGVQTKLFTELLHKAGHDVTIFGTFGHHGAVVKSGGIDVLPQSLDQYGRDMLMAHLDFYKPDAAVLLYDIWVYDDRLLPPLTAWCPVDHDPITPTGALKFQQVRSAWAMSRFAEKQLRRFGVESFYVPHGVDTAVYTPGDRSEARKIWFQDDDTFLVAMVAANKGYPSRKSLDRVLKAWSVFVKRHPKSVLYLHTRPSGVHDGPNLEDVRKFYGIPDDKVTYPDPYRFERGDYIAPRMNALFNAADVLLAPSMAEGFGIPVIEAQAAGCPVIVSDFTAQSELAGPGYKIAIDDDDKLYSPFGSEWTFVKPSRILESLEWAFEHKNDLKLRQQSREFAMQYDAQTVLDRYMLPALIAQQDLDVARQRRTNARKALRTKATAVNPECREKGHSWAPVGWWASVPAEQNGELRSHGDPETVLAIPCLRKDCEAQRRVEPNGKESVVETGFGLNANGIKLDIDDDPTGAVAKIVCREIEHAYRLEEIPFEPGDVVLDVGAHVGVVSIYLAKKHPDIKIYAFEPLPANFARLQRNLQANGVTNVVAVNKAVSGDGRKLALTNDTHINSGGNSAFVTPNGGGVLLVESITLIDIFNQYQLEGRVKLLKLDCEGAEYEIVGNATPELLKDCYVRGEVHTNKRLTAAGHSPDKLRAWLEKSIPADHIVMQPCVIAE